MTPQELAKLQRDYLILTEKRSAVALDAEFAALRREISSYLRSNLTPETRAAAQSFIDEIIALLDVETEKFARSAASIVARAQRSVINFASDSLKKFFPKIDSSIFTPDVEAIQNLIGRAQNGKSLVKFFARLNPVVATAARTSLVEGFAAGESSTEIAKRIDDAAGTGRYRALVISRNESVMAYRNASVEFFDNAGIKEYRFISSLDQRTCLVCWRLHGTIWKLKTKPYIHVGCRCVVVPVLNNSPTVETGTEAFAKLEKGYQQQILGKSRFEKFEREDFSLSNFVDSKTDQDFGQSYFIKNLSDLD